MGDVHLSGLPKEVVQGSRRENLGETLKFERFHHYYRRGRLASQFCVVSRAKKGEWGASHQLPNGENLYRDAILPLAKAVHFEMEDHESAWVYEPGQETINLQFYYPILVTKGEIYECFLGGSRPRYRRVHRVGFIRRYHSEKMKGEYRIDVVSESGFYRLIKDIDKEVSEIAKRIKRQQSILRRSANEIAKERVRERKKNKR